MYFAFKIFNCYQKPKILTPKTKINMTIWGRVDYLTKTVNWGYTETIIKTCCIFKCKGNQYADKNAYN